MVGERYAADIFVASFIRRLAAQFQPDGKTQLARTSGWVYLCGMPATVRREFSLKALQHALDATADQVRENLTAKGLPRFVLENGALIRIAPDGTRKRMPKASANPKRGAKPAR